MTTLTVEWLVETLDDAADAGPDPDIHDVNHAATYAEALKMAEGLPRVRLGLVRDRWSDRGTESRSWAYVVDGKLPDGFTDAFGEHVAKVPARYHNELKAAA